MLSLFGALCVDSWQTGWGLFLLLFVVLWYIFWNWAKKTFKTAESAADLRSHCNFITICYHSSPSVKMMGFLGRNIAACLTLSCVCLLIHRAYCCSTSRSQLATCRRAEAGSCLPYEGGGILELQGHSATFRLACFWNARYISMRKQTLTACL